MWMRESDAAHPENSSAPAARSGHRLYRWTIDLGICNRNIPSPPKFFAGKLQFQELDRIERSLKHQHVRNHLVRVD